MNIIYVDDERMARDCFEYEAKMLEGISSLNLFSRAADALEFARQNEIDAAFLDIEMPDMSGILLAKALRKVHPDMSIIFVTAYSHYALEAFDADAIGYVLKPYDSASIEHALRKAERMKPVCEKRILIQTIPTFMVRIDGKPVQFSSSKSEEMLALLVDRAGRAMMPGEIISCLWPDRAMDEKTTALLRMTYRRLVLRLRSIGAEGMLITQGKRRSLNTDMVDCDLYRIMNGDKRAESRYSGEYLREYSWAEMTNAMLDKMTALSSEKEAAAPASHEMTQRKASDCRLIYIRAFGSFEAFYRGVPMRFKYERSREMLAYLIDRNGAFCTKAELMDVLFKGEKGHDAYLKKLREDLITTFEGVGCGACIVKQRGRLAVNTLQLSCDYYDWLNGANNAGSVFRGEYMKQYSWAAQKQAAIASEHGIV